MNVIALLFSLLLIFFVVALPFIFIIFLVRILMSGSRGNRSRMTAEETRAMQEIHRGLERMEKRVEALETIVLDRTGRPSTHHEALDRDC